MFADAFHLFAWSYRFGNIIRSSNNVWDKSKTCTLYGRKIDLYFTIVFFWEFFALPAQSCVLCCRSEVLWAYFLCSHCSTHFRFKYDVWTMCEWDTQKVLISAAFVNVMFSACPLIWMQHCCRSMGKREQNPFINCRIKNSYFYGFVTTCVLRRCLSLSFVYTTHRFGLIHSSITFQPEQVNLRSLSQRLFLCKIK